MLKQRKKAYSISFSIAYMHVADWAKDPEHYARPKEDVLKQAEVHARRLRDWYILEKIKEIRAYYEKVDSTPTPKRPGRTAQADAIAAQKINPIKEISIPEGGLMCRGTAYSGLSDDVEKKKDQEELLDMFEKLDSWSDLA